MTTEALPADRVGLIKSRLFADLGVLDEVDVKHGEYRGKPIRRIVQTENTVLEYGDCTPEVIESADPTAKVPLVKRPVVVPVGYSPPVSIGLDTSYGTRLKVIKGNGTYLWATVLVSQVDGSVSERVTEDVRDLIRYVLMVSDKQFTSKGSRSCVVPHHLLQETMDNMMKVVGEGTLPSDALRRLVRTLVAGGYAYKPENPSRTIIFKDGPLLSHFFEPFGDVLLATEVPARFVDVKEIYDTMLQAGLQGIPVVGVTKHAVKSIIGAHYGSEDVFDYAIIRQIAEGDKYFYVGPFVETHARNPNLTIEYYYLYLEDRFSPLRIEVAPNLLPQGLQGNQIVEDILMSLMCTSQGELQHNGEYYKLPPCIAQVDQSSRAIAHRLSERLREKVRMLALKVPGAIIQGT